MSAGIGICRWIGSFEHLLCKNAHGSSMPTLLVFAKITRCHQYQQIDADSSWSPVTLKARIVLTSEEMLESTSLVSGLLEEGETGPSWQGVKALWEPLVLMEELSFHYAFLCSHHSQMEETVCWYFGERCV